MRIWIIKLLFGVVRYELIVHAVLGTDDKLIKRTACHVIDQLSRASNIIGDLEQLGFALGVNENGGVRMLCLYLF
mgnify:CR=1 FL=1